MALYEIENRYPDYIDRFSNVDSVVGADVYVHRPVKDEQIGNVHTILIDEHDCLRYLVINAAAWVPDKRVLLPIGRCVDDPEHNRIYAIDLYKDQINQLPEYRDESLVDRHYEEQVRQIYQMTRTGELVPVESAVSGSQPAVRGYVAVSPAAQSMPPLQPSESETTRSETTRYSQEPNQDQTNDHNHQQLRLFEERLLARKHRAKTGEVKVSKRVVTETVEGSIPVQKEKIIIEIESIVGTTQVNLPDGHWQSGDVATVEVFEDQVELRKEPVVSQQINIRKEVEQDVVTVQETVRREELEVHTEGDPHVTDYSH